MRAIDLNADLGEADRVTPTDLALIGLVSSASLACGFHAGTRSVMRETARRCVSSGVSIGAHVSYRDRAGFGRRPLDPDPADLAGDLIEQWETLAAEVDAAGGTISYVKTHGALYHAAATDPAVATVVVDTFGVRCPTVVAPPDSALEEPARAAGIRLVREGFCDRGYRSDGALVPRGEAGAELGDPHDAAVQARSLAVGGGVVPVGGGWVDLEVETLCVHSDHPGAARTAEAVRRSLEEVRVTIRPFAAPEPP